MEKILIIIMILSLMMAGNAQNNILRGIVKLQSSGSQAIEGVEISAFGAGTVYSNSAGMFEMRFREKIPGVAVRLLISRSGYEVVNEKELERCILREDPDDLITVVLAKAGDRNKQAMAYYNIIVSNTNKKYEKNLSDIKNQLVDLNIDQEERKLLRQQISSLQEEKRKLIEKAEDLARQLSSIDLDQASILAQNAYKSFNAGDIEGALSILGDETLRKNLQSSKNEVSRVKEKMFQANQSFQQSVENYMIKARMYVSLGKYNMAKTIYVQAVEADSANIQNIHEVADYFNDLNDQKGALKYYTQAMELSSSIPSKILLHIEIGNQHRLINNYKSAHTAYTDALELSKKIPNEEKEQYNLVMAHVHYAWGLYQMGLNKPEEATDEFINSLNKWKLLNNNSSNKYLDYEASVLVNLGAIYTQEGDLDKATDIGIEYVKIYESLFATDSIDFQQDLIAAYIGLGTVYAYKDAYLQVEELFLSASAKLKIMADIFPQKYESDLARMYGNLGALYIDMRILDKAEIALLTGKGILKKLARNNPFRYDNSLAITLNNLGGLYSNSQQYQKAMDVYSESLQIRRQLYAENQVATGPGLLLTLLNTSGLKKTLLESTLDMNYKEEGQKLILEAQSIIDDIGISSSRLQSLNEGIDYFNNYFLNINKEGLLIQNELKKIVPLEGRIESTSMPKIMIATSYEIIDSLSSFLIKYPDNPALVSRLAQAYGTLSWHYMLNKEYNQAVISGEKGLTVNADSYWCKSYLATAYLYSDKYEKAINIFMELKDQPDGSRTYTETFLDDFDTLEELGITHVNVAKIRKLLIN